MEAVSMAIGGATYYVATKFVDQFISQEGYGRLRKMLFPKERYVDRLYQLIEETAAEFEVEYPIESDKVPFYQSQPLFDVLNEYILFEELLDKTELLNKFSNRASKQFSIQIFITFILILMLEPLHLSLLFLLMILHFSSPSKKISYKNE